MGALPKKKLSKARTRNRRSKFAAIMPTLTHCSNCKEAIPLHRVCPYCGYFKGEQILKV